MISFSRQLIIKLTAKIFAPYESNIQGEQQTPVFLLQSNSSQENFFASKFNNSTSIQYSHFDFINASEDESEIAKVYKEDIAMLFDMETNFDDKGDKG